MNKFILLNKTKEEVVCVYSIFTKKYKTKLQNKILSIDNRNNYLYIYNFCNKVIQTFECYYLDFDTFFITLEDVIMWNKKLNMTSTYAIRDYNLLISITQTYNQEIFGYIPYKTILEKAAYIWFALTKYHCFENGNKRTALITLYMFLFQCGYYLSFPKTNVDYYIELYNMSKMIASGQSSKNQIIEFLYQYICIDLEHHNIQVQKNLYISKKNYVSFSLELLAKNKKEIFQKIMADNFFMQTLKLLAME